MLARRNGLALLCTGALLSAVAIASNSGTALAAPKQEPPPASAAAADPAEEAKGAFNAGKEKFDKGDFAGALPEFQRADQLYPGAAPKHRIALCLDKLGRAREAIAAYRAFIESQPGEKYADRVAESGARIAELEATLPAMVKLSVTPADAPGIQVAVDGKPVEGLSFEVAAGAHTVVVSAEGYQPLTEQLTVKGAEERELALTLAPAQAAPPPPPPPEEESGDGGGSDIPAYVTLGIAGAGVVLGTIFGVMALGAKSDFEEDPTTENADAAERDALIADMSFGVALTFGITGIVLLFTGGEDEPAEEAPVETATPTFVPYGGPRGGGLSATWRF